MQVEINKRTIIIVVILGVVLSIYYFVRVVAPRFSIFDLFSSNKFGFSCNKNINWYNKKTKQVHGILGFEESGLPWLRYLIEQMTSLYTGSAERKYTDYFKGEGKRKQVIAIASDVIWALPRLHSAVIVYRNMKDVVRTQFANLYGQPHNQIEVPLHAYYGKHWEKFAIEQAEVWADRYMSYLEPGRPTIIVGYEELSDPVQIRKHLLRISNMLQVPIMTTVVDCLARHSPEFTIKPIPLRRSGNPFMLLPSEVRKRLEALEVKVIGNISHTRDSYVPRVAFQEWIPPE